MLKALIIKKLAVLAITTAATVAIPYLVQDRPRLKWAFDKLGPRVVDVTTDKVDDYLRHK
jgi:hypothetical protein